ncbi:MAG: tRNA lysidine(34) synthetase TilS [Clostridia bacterium]|nr:tRNA lysidine(34) synthetase TilS [Clostridia bacterium]
MMKTKVLNTITKFNMLNSGDTVVAAVSGGADSIAMLHLLWDLKSVLDISIRAVHINHNLRGDESLRDENFVRDFCEQNNIPLDVISVDIKGICADTKTGIEECARIQRYKLFSEIAGDSGKIATAHTLSDAAETLIFNICRGSGIKGVCSIPPVRDNIIRPLIEVSRDEVELYIADNGLSFVTDSTNLEDDYTRNDIRHNIIPKLCEINPAFLQAASRLINSARMVDEYVENEARALIEQGITAADAKNIDKVLLCKYIELRCKNELSVTLESKHVEAAVQTVLEGTGVCQLPKNTFLKVENGNIILTNTVKENTQPFCVPLTVGNIKTPYKNYTVLRLTKAEYENQQKVNKLLFKYTLDCDKISENALLRSRGEGDAIKLQGRGCTKTLKKLFCESKIPLNLRGEYAVISDGDRLLWAEGFGVSQFAAVTENTENMLVIQIEGEDHYQ